MVKTYSPVDMVFEIGQDKVVVVVVEKNSYYAEDLADKTVADNRKAEENNTVEGIDSQKQSCILQEFILFIVLMGFIIGQP